MEELKQRFPDGVDFSIVYDTTPFIEESVNEVFNSLRDAVFLVAIVVLIFLQGWRAAVIPLVAVPVAIIGTFAAMAAFGFSLNTLTLFGLVLAVGIVVDDAIVVVEAIEHHIEHGLAPRDAAIKAMDEVAGPVIAIGLVLSAVFIPCTVISGIVGQFFRQFALTIAISTLISTFNSLTLSPALAVLLLKKRSAGGGEALPRMGFILVGAWAGYMFLAPVCNDWLIAKYPQVPHQYWSWIVGAALAIVLFLASWPINMVLLLFFRAFNWLFNWITRGYVGIVGLLLRGSLVVVVGYGALLFMTVRMFEVTPTGFIPPQDKGYLLVNVSLPDSSSLARTQQLLSQVDELARKTPGVKHTVAIAGQSLLLGANSSNFASMYVMLDDFHSRMPQHQTADLIAQPVASVVRSKHHRCAGEYLRSTPH